MANFYIQTIKNGIEYEIPANVIETIRLTYGLDDNTEIVFCATIPEDDKLAASEGRALRFEAAYDIAKNACKTELVSKATEPTVTNETLVETPEEKNEKTEEEIKMDKTLKNAITAGVKEVNEKFASALEKAIADYNAAKETVKKVREEETVKVDAAKTAYEATVKGTAERRMASAILNTAKKAKAKAVSDAVANRAIKKATVDDLKLQLAQQLEEVICGVIQGFDVKPVTETVTVEEPVDDKPVEEPTVVEETENTDSGTGTSVDDEPTAENTPVNDEPATDDTPVDKPATDAPAPLPVKTFAVLSFGNVGNKVEAFRAKILASTKYAWKEVQAWKQADLIRVYTQAGAKVTNEERNELAALLQAEKAAPGRVHFNRVA